MAHQHTPPQLSQRTEYLETDNDSDRDSGVGEDAGDDADSCHGSTVAQGEREGREVNKQDGMEENSGEGGDFTVFVAFQGNMEDEDFTHKLDTILSGIPNILDMG